MKLYVAVFSVRDWKPAFGASLIGLQNYILTQATSVTEVKFSIMSGASLISKVRQAALDQSIKEGYDHLLMLDDDMVFPPYTADMLLRHKLPFVAANYNRKVPIENAALAFDFEGKPVDSAVRFGLEKVYFVGTGVCLINLSAVKDIPKPHFEVLWSEERNSYEGEDFYFCKKLSDHGIDIYIDHDLSRHIGHVGDYEYRFRGREAVSNIFQLDKAA